MYRLTVKWVVLLLALVLTACGSMTFTRTRTVFEPYSATEGRQEKDGVIAELKFIRDVPQSFKATVQRCDSAGRLMVGPLGPSMETVTLNQPGQYWEQIAFTNNTNHVLRMNSVVIRLFDPAGNEVEPLTWEDLQSTLVAGRPCPTSMNALQIFKINKVFSRNIEVVPGTTTTFWLAFRPASMGMTGVWKLAIYEVPVSVDSAGRPTRTAKFDMRIVAKQFTDTLVRDNPLAPARLIESKEVGGGGDTGQAASAAQQSAAAHQAESSPATAKAPPANPSSMSPEAAGLAATQPPSKAMVLRAQIRLRELGFDPGGADGSMGPHTSAALRRFQASRKLPATGQLTPQTLEALEVPAS
jgi:hypothetical protein